MDPGKHKYNPKYNNTVFELHLQKITREQDRTSYRKLLKVIEAINYMIINVIVV